MPKLLRYRDNLLNINPSMLSIDTDIIMSFRINPRFKYSESKNKDCIISSKHMLVGGYTVIVSEKTHNIIKLFGIDCRLFKCDDKHFFAYTVFLTDKVDNLIYLISYEQPDLKIINCWKYSSKNDKNLIFDYNPIDKTLNSIDLYKTEKLKHIIFNMNVNHIRDHLDLNILIFNF